MQNHMRETVDAGLADLQAHRAGLPTPPPSAAAPGTPAGFDQGAPGPDPNAAAQINQQYQEADKAVQETLSQGSSGFVPRRLSPHPTPTTAARQNHHRSDPG